MQRASRPPRDITGYGEGAATPSPTSLNAPARNRLKAQTDRASRQTGWKPTVQRQRPTTAPSAPAQRPVNVERPKAAPAQKAAPTSGGTMRALPRGFGKTAGIFSTMEAGFGAAQAKGWSKMPTPVRTAFKPTAGVYGGVVGKINLASDAIFIADGLKKIFDPTGDARALMDSAASEKYASLADAENQTRWNGAMQIAGIAIDNVAQVMIQKGIEKGGEFLLRRLASAGFAAAFGGPIGFIAAIVIFAALDRLMKGERAPEISGSASETVENVGSSVGIMATPITSWAGGVLEPYVMPSIRSINWNDVAKNSPAEVEALKRERNSERFTTGTMLNDAGEEVSATFIDYSNGFGRRTDEVKVLLSLGYFMTAPVDADGKPLYTTWVHPGTGEVVKYREYVFNGQAFEKWFENSDWTFGKAKPIERVSELPALDDFTVKDLATRAMTKEEMNAAMNAYYDLIKGDAGLKRQ